MPSVAALHDTVHGLLATQRRADDTYGEPLQTALVVAALTAHPEEYHDDARTAARALIRLWRDATPALSGRDVAAACVVARCASDLGTADAAIEGLARSRSHDLLDRGLALAPFHLALLAHSWRALASAGEWPWAELHRRATGHRVAGVDAGLLAYARALSAEHDDAVLLLEDLLAATTVAGSLSERCVLLWLLDRGLVAARGTVGGDDRGLRYLIERRGVVEGRLAAEIDRDTFEEPPVDEEFDADGRDRLLGLQRLGPFEAALLDWALVERAASGSNLSLTEAEAFFGDRLAAERRRTYDVDVRRVRQLTGAVAALGLALGGCATLALQLDGYRAGVSVAWGVMILVVGLLSAAWVRSRGPDRAPSEEVWAFLVTLSLVAGYLLYDQTKADPATDNPVEYALGLLIPAAALALAVAAVRRTRTTTSARPSGDDRAP
jgi:hypothetical protein